MRFYIYKKPGYEPTPHKSHVRHPQQLHCTTRKEHLLPSNWQVEVLGVKNKEREKISQVLEERRKEYEKKGEKSASCWSKENKSARCWRRDERKKNREKNQPGVGCEMKGKRKKSLRCWSKGNLHSLGLTTPRWSIVELYQLFNLSLLSSDRKVACHSHGGETRPN